LFWVLGSPSEQTVGNESRKTKTHWKSVKYRPNQQQPNQQQQLLHELRNKPGPSGQGGKFDEQSKTLPHPATKDSKKHDSMLSSTVKDSKAGVLMSTELPAGGKWNVSSTSLWMYPLDLLVKNVTELRQLQQFINRKVI